MLLLLVVPTNQNEAKIIGSAFLWTTVPAFLTGPGQLNKWRLNICSNIELTNTAFVNSTIITRNIETAVLSKQYHVLQLQLGKTFVSSGHVCTMFLSV